MAVRWVNLHGDYCPVTRARRAIEDEPPSSYKAGVIAELDNNGDDEVESCTCNTIAAVYLELHHKHAVHPEPPMKFRSVSPGPDGHITVIDGEGATQVLLVEEWSPRFVFSE